MTLNRTTPITAGTTGAAYMAEVNEEIGGLWDRSACILTGIGGTANDITATLTPALTAGLIPGMSFYLKPTSTNTGAVRLFINGGAPVSVKDSFGSALSNGILQASAQYLLVTDGTDLIIIGSSTMTKINDFQQFTASGTWTKPANCPANARVWIEGEGAGGGGGYTGLDIRNSGGGGGGYNQRIMRAGDLPSTVAVTIGAGGARGSNGVAGTAGGNSTFGAFLTAFGGAGGYSSSSGVGYGGGGGSTTTAGNASAGAGPAPQSGLGYGHHGGKGGDLDVSGAENSVDGGGGGGGHGLTTPTAAGSSYRGGGGGQSVGNPNTNKGAAGTSVRAGNGGLAGANGSAPGGGGGGGGNGARGEIRVWVQG